MTATKIMEVQGAEHRSGVYDISRGFGTERSSHVLRDSERHIVPAFGKSITDLQCFRELAVLSLGDSFFDLLNDLDLGDQLQPVESDTHIAGQTPIDLERSERPTQPNLPAFRIPLKCADGM